MGRRAVCGPFAGLVPLVLIVLAFAACGGGAKPKDDGGAGESGADLRPDRNRDGRAGSGGGGTTGAAGDDGGAPDAEEPADVADEAALGQVFTCPADQQDAAADAPVGSDAAGDATVAGAVTFLPNVIVTTIAGSSTRGSANGGAEATFADPVSVVIDNAGNLIIADFENDALRRIAMPSGTVAVTTLTKKEGFRRPYGLAFAGGSLYVNTDFNALGSKSNITGTIWKVDLTTGEPTVVGPNLGRPRGLAVLRDGRLVLADYQNSRVRILNGATGAVAELAGSAGCHGFADGQGTKAVFGVPYGVAVLPDGRVIVADASNHILRVVTLTGVVSTFAGDGGDGTVDGPAVNARFSLPSGLTVDLAGNVYVSDQGAHRIRRVDVNGVVTTVAGDGTGGFQDGAGNVARFFGVEGIAVSNDGKVLYVADGSLGEDINPHHRVRRIALGP